MTDALVVVLAAAVLAATGAGLALVWARALAAVRISDAAVREARRAARYAPRRQT